MNFHSNLRLQVDQLMFTSLYGLKKIIKQWTNGKSDLKLGHHAFDTVLYIMMVMVMMMMMMMMMMMIMIAVCGYSLFSQLCKRHVWLVDDDGR